MLELILLLILIGVVMWAVNAYIPMAEPIKTILNVVVAVAVVFYVLQAFGVFAAFSDMPLPQVGHHTR